MATPTKREPLAFLPTASDGPQTMSSVEIAELTGKRHAHVIRDIRAMLIGLYGDEEVERIVPDQYRNRHSEYVRENADAIFSAMVGHEPNRVHPPRGFSWERDKRGYIVRFDLDRSHTITVVTGYNVKARKAIIDRWEELERAARQPALDLNNPADLRLLLANYANDNLELQGQIADLTPKAEALDRLSTADGSFCITDAAKTLQVRPKDLFQFLRSHRWIYSRPGGAGDLAYQSHLTSGCLEHKTTTIHRSDGSEKVTTQVRVTPKGLARLAREFAPAARPLST